MGRLDVVKTFFNEDGCLKANAKDRQMESGFMWACEYGRTNVVEFLLALMSSRSVSASVFDVTESVKIGAP